MSKYGDVARKAAIKARAGVNPIDAWKQSAMEVFPTKKASRNKGCPRCAFLGLAEDGLLKGVPSGSYTDSYDNKRYAVEAVRILRQRPELAENIAELWGRVSEGNKKHNGQLDVVVALWRGNDV
jgi:hypothetical protein